MDFLKIICTKFNLRPDSDVAKRMCSMDRTISSWGSASKIKLEDMYKAALADNETMMDWMIYAIFGDELREVIEKIKQVDMLATSGDESRISASYASKFLSDRTLVSKTKDMAEKRLNTTIEQIKRIIYRRYVARRGKMTADGKIDTSINMAEMKKCDDFLDNILNNIQEFRRVHRNNSNAYYMKGVMDDYAINFKYKREKYKEVICNTFRFTPESFDEWYDAIEAENAEFITQDGGEGKTFQDTVMNTTNQARMNDLIRKHGHLLVKDVDTPAEKAVYISEFCQVVDKTEAENIEASLRKYKNKPEVLDIWTDHLKNMANVHKKAVARSVGIVVPEKRFGEATKDEKVIVRDVTRSMVEERKQRLKNSRKPLEIKEKPQVVEDKKEQEIFDFI